MLFMKKKKEKEPGALKVGVVGIGHLGQHHARIYHELPQSELVGVVDASLERAKEFGDRFNCFASDKYQDLFEKVQAVSIVTPTSWHYPIAREFLKRRIPVLLEKPMTRTAEQAKALLDISKRLKVPLQIGHVERFNAAIDMLQKLKQTPRFIESIRQGPFDGRVKDTGVVLDLMIHDLDIILDLVDDSPVVQLEAVGVNVLTAFEDIANARIHFKNGCVANVTASRISPERLRKIRVFQPSSYISIDYMNQKVTVLKLKQGLQAGGSIDPQHWRDAIQREQVPITRKEPLRMELISFIQCVKEKKDPKVSGQHGYAALKLALDIVKAVRLQGRRSR